MEEDEPRISQKVKVPRNNLSKSNKTQAEFTSRNVIVLQTEQLLFLIKGLNE